MSRVGNFFQCLAESIASRGFKGLVKMVPFGEELYDIAADVLKRYRDRTEVRGDIEAVVQATTEEIKHEATEVADRVAADPDEREALTTYLSQVPATARRSLQRPGDPVGTTVPPTVTFEKPEHLLPMLPPRPPRFRPGDRPEVIGGWVLKELLGCGGFGEVWRAHHPDFAATEAAFKFCLDRDAQDRLLRHEARVLNQVMGQSRHPGIVPLLDANLNVDPAWLKYEYVPGGDLCSVIRDWANLQPDVRQRCAGQMMLRLAEIVGHFHRLAPPVVHRDLKPANILIEAIETNYSSQELRPRVADFGIGGISSRRALEQSRRSTSGADLGASLRGSHTPLYASPQQRRGGEPDVRDDVFSLAIIWYQMLLGDPGAERPGGQGWRKRLGGAGVPAAHLDLLERSWDDDPTTRPADAALLAEELRTSLGKPPVAPPAEVPPSSPPGAPGPTRTTTERPERTERKPRRPGQTVKIFLPSVKTSGFFGLRTSVVPVEMELAWVPPGTFQMGSPEHEVRREPDENLHTVKLTRGVHVGVHPVTVGQFRSFVQATGYKTEAERSGGAYAWVGKGMAWIEGEWKQDARTSWASPGFTQTDQHPVTCVTHRDAENFCKWLAGVCEKPIRLPTEAEWEYACRAGTTTPYSFGETISTDQANYNGTYVYGKGKKGIVRGQTTQAGTFPANAWGLCDMHGNVWEWCADEYGPYPEEECVVDPFGRYLDESRILRGGSWQHGPVNCRSAKRVSKEETDYIGADKRSPGEKQSAKKRDGSDRCSCVGFRIVLAEE